MKSRRNEHHDQAGFTLLEVLLAIALLAIALPFCSVCRNFDLELHARADKLTQATMLAQEKLMETELLGVYPMGEVVEIPRRSARRTDADAGGSSQQIPMEA